MKYFGKTLGTLKVFGVLQTHFELGILFRILYIQARFLAGGHLQHDYCMQIQSILICVAPPVTSFTRGLKKPVKTFTGRTRAMVMRAPGGGPSVYVVSGKLH